MALTDRAEEILAKQLGNGRAVELRAALDLAYGSGGNDTLNDRGRYLVSKIFGRTRGEEFCAIADAAGRIGGDRAGELLNRAFGQSDGVELFAEFDDAYPDVMPPTISIPVNGAEISANYLSSFVLAGDDWFTIDIPVNDPPVDTTVHLTCTGGAFTAFLPSDSNLTFTLGGQSTDEMIFYGARADVLAAVASVRLTTEAAPPDTTTVSVSVSNTGGSDSAEFDFTISGPSYSPNVIVGGDETIPMDDPYAITGIDLTDAESKDQEVVVTVTNGTASLNSLTGLSFSNGDGTDDVTMTFSGPLASVVSAIETITFTPTGSFTGAASLTISTTNTYGATDSETLGITVEAP
jgi:hypothetical protein